VDTAFFDELCSKSSEKINYNLSLFSRCPQIFVYGTGTFAQEVQSELRAKGHLVTGFIEHRQINKTHLNGLPIYTPDQAALVKHSYQSVVVLGLHSFQANTSVIIENLRSVGLNQTVTPVDLYDLLGTELGVRYWLVNRQYYFTRFSFIQKVAELLSDPTSSSILQSVIEFRLTGDVTKLPLPDFTNQYHPADLLDWKGPLRFVDCGAFTGDTIDSFLKSDISFESVAAFEPDQANYYKLASFVVENKRAIPEACLFPCGVYSTSKQLSFQLGQGMASNISDQGMTIIQCVALDDAIPTFAPNYIKMDIEGAEYDAILGARQLISNHTPLIAVSLYHRPEHLWQLPILIESLTPERYNFHMRLHAYNDFDLVLYAIPKEKE